MKLDTEDNTWACCYGEPAFSSELGPPEPDSRPSFEDCSAKDAKASLTASYEIHTYVLKVGWMKVFCPRAEDVKHWAKRRMRRLFVPAATMRRSKFNCEQLSRCFEKYGLTAQTGAAPGSWAVSISNSNSAHFAYLQSNIPKAL